MERRTFGAKGPGSVDIDVCFPCHAIWFDQFESAQLAPDAIIHLFRDINDHRNDPIKPIAEGSKCPRCSTRLALTQDIQRSNKLTYYRCPMGHGRLTTFFMFLRENNFIRSLSKPEVETLRAQVKQIRCSSCGAPIDLERMTECPYCHAPVSMLDPDLVRRTLLELDGEQRKAQTLDAQRLAQVVLAAGRTNPAMKDGMTWQASHPDFGSELGNGIATALTVAGTAGLLHGAADLVGLALEHLFEHE